MKFFSPIIKEKELEKSELTVEKRPNINNDLELVEKLYDSGTQVQNLEDFYDNVFPQKELFQDVIPQQEEQLLKISDPLNSILPINAKMFNYQN